MLQEAVRRNEIAISLPPVGDAELHFIGRILTPWQRREDAPRQGDMDGPQCTIEVFSPWSKALEGIEKYSSLEVLYWLHQSRRDILLQSPANNGEVHGAFSIRSPVRPNPIGTAIVTVVGVSGNHVVVRGLDCIDGTPLIDIKPERSLSVPIAPPKGGHPMDVE
ncbi:tRNA (N6-threonylcarbamoyladenosine(37)-N6)-methyltransferase TrmO [Rhizobium sp. 2MFCol3.1]|uniref:tRNA (N6-threonylcarbamoyladenosine(37)-N6)-methyltransferase TrmO n=1 Tax=Rhizobium sp. 2MFCol3.1 TaxID=1246459 RepID=UPI00036AD605|nr:tRNA (N6-threonylcarbamoyladenosine(37)-N6)-methyltransferase TrmO [Rhizobium sp. 2MFCol3.1]